MVGKAPRTLNPGDAETGSSPLAERRSQQLIASRKSWAALPHSHSWLSSAPPELISVSNGVVHLLTAAFEAEHPPNSHAVFSLPISSVCHICRSLCMPFDDFQDFLPQ
jgi:hypothetical protein